MTAQPDPVSNRPAAPLGTTTGWAALQQRNFRVFYTAHFVSMCGTWMQIVVQGWLVWSLTHSELACGLLTVASYAPTLIFSWAAGPLADTWERRRILLVTQTAALLLAALLGVAALSPGLQAWHVIAIATCCGIVNAFDLPTRHAFVAELVDRDLLANAVSLNYVLFNAARVVGPALASLLVAVPWIRLSGCFFVNALSFAGVLVALYGMQVPVLAWNLSSPESEAGALAGLRYAWRTPAVGGVIAVMTVAGTFGWSLSVVLPSMTANILGGGATLYSALETTSGAGAVIGCVLLAYIGALRHDRLFICGGLWLWFAAVGVFSLSGWFPLWMLTMVLAGLGKVFVMTTSNALVQTRVPNALRGRVMALWTLIFAVAEPVGSIQTGLLARWRGPVFAVRVIAAALGLTALAALLIVRRSAAKRPAVSGTPAGAP